MAIKIVQEKQQQALKNAEEKGEVFQMNDKNLEDQIQEELKKLDEQQKN